MQSYLVDQITEAMVGDFLKAYRPMVSSVSSKMRRWIYRSTAPNMMRLGYSWSQSVKLMRQFGVGFRRTEMNKLWNQMKGEFDKALDIAKFGRTERLTEDITTKTGKAMPTTYRVVVGYSYTDTVTGLQTFETKSLYMNQLPSFQELEDHLPWMLGAAKYHHVREDVQLHKVLQVYQGPWVL